MLNIIDYMIIMPNNTCTGTPTLVPGLAILILRTPVDEIEVGSTTPPPVKLTLANSKISFGILITAISHDILLNALGNNCKLIIELLINH